MNAARVAMANFWVEKFQVVVLWRCRCGWAGTKPMQDARLWRKLKSRLRKGGLTFWESMLQASRV